MSEDRYIVEIIKPTDNIIFNIICLKLGIDTKEDVKPLFEDLMIVTIKNNSISSTFSHQLYQAGLRMVKYYLVDIISLKDLVFIESTLERSRSIRNVINESIRRPFLYFENIAELGNLDMHFGEVEREAMPLQPVLKVIENKIEDTFLGSLRPGYFDVNKVFFERPISIFYFQLDLIVLTIYRRTQSESKTKLEVYFKLFDKEFKTYNDFRIEISNEENKSLLRHDVTKHFINRLNYFVHQGGDINLLKLENKSLRDFQLKSPKILIDVINQLEITIFNCYYTPSHKAGAETDEWFEVEIRNTPNDYYLFNLLKSSLKNSMETDFGLLYKLNESSYYGQSDERIQLFNDEADKYEKKLKDELKINTAINYNANNHFNDTIIR